MQNEFQIKELKEKLTNKYGKQFDNLWYKWAEEMYKAKALKYIVTRLPIQEEIIAVGHIEDAEIAESEEPKAEAKQQPKSNPLKAFKEEPNEEPQDADIEEQISIDKVKENLQNYMIDRSSEEKAELVQLLRNGTEQELRKKCKGLGLC